jgi:alkaline phosphatase
MQLQTGWEAAAGAARNVILLISDGAGYSTWEAASHWRHGELGKEAYDAFEVARFMSTFPLNTSSTPTFSVESEVGYDPARAWSDAPSTQSYRGYAPSFQGYDYLRAAWTDSAAAGTGIASGQLTYNNALNVDNFGNPLLHIGNLAVESGRELGVVTSVQWSHATPAAFLAQNATRNDYVGIARQIVEEGQARVVMGAGHPFYDDNAQPREPAPGHFRFVGGEETLADLLAGRTAYRFIDSLEEFEALAAGTFDLAPGDRILGTARVANTLQYNRAGDGMDPLNEGVPSLETMTLGALRVLQDSAEGFFLMIEGGAVDWAAHANNLPRIIEEQVAFNRSVEAVVRWVETHSSWDETLVIVTTDHGNGLMLGPDSDTVFFQPIIGQGQGELPLVQWHSNTHTNELVPIWAHGAGSDLIAALATRPDPGLANLGVPEEMRYWLQHNELFDAMAVAMGITRSDTMAEPVDWNALAARVTANYEATGSWFVGAAVPDPAGPLAPPVDWNALAARVTANYEATGSWFA